MSAERSGDDDDDKNENINAQGDIYVFAEH